MIVNAGDRVRIQENDRWHYGTVVGPFKLSGYTTIELADGVQWMVKTDALIVINILEEIAEASSH